MHCHVIVADAVLAEVKNGQDEVRLSDLRNLSHEEVQGLRLVDGNPPAAYVQLTADASSGVVLYRGKNVHDGKVYLHAGVAAM